MSNLVPVPEWVDEYDAAEADKDVWRALNVIMGQLAELSSRVTAGEEDLETLTGEHNDAVMNSIAGQAALSARNVELVNKVAAVDSATNDRFGRQAEEVRETKSGLEARIEWEANERERLKGQLDITTSTLHALATAINRTSGQYLL